MIDHSLAEVRKPTRSEIRAQQDAERIRRAQQFLSTAQRGGATVVPITKMWSLLVGMDGFR
jgi:hypothetical protein